MRKRLLTTAMAAVVALGTAAPQLAHAQEKSGGAGDQAPAAVQPEALEVSAQEVAAFSEAALRISEIRQEYASDFRTARETGNKEMMQGLVKELRLTAEKILSEVDGMDKKRYTEIATSLQGNPELRERIMKVMRKGANDGKTGGDTAE